MLKLIENSGNIKIGGYMPSSFLCEHSVEFLLVPKFNEILSDEFTKIVPLYFWSTREGSRIALDCLKGVRIRVVALYVRRPKVEFPYQNEITIKLNNTLFKTAYYLQMRGIQVFAGAPLISSISELNSKANCVWFQINSSYDYDYEMELIINKSTKIIDFIGNRKAINGPLSDYNILDIINLNSKYLLWDDAIKIFKENKYFNYHERYFGFNYKPVYFILL